ncbi:M56 family metallopeptidase [Stenotrophomonas sp. C3(2023)]|uniref:M56 family metallopeptidase n=1 Tax=Stenotrophomonas sp. C3(2023) TaxID=3080277 RepID=UPI00293C8D78|nr:M56 family metallopeptidase [Stenotrophomonas sp. C3(2023)]MDV3467265.1 M56 family metallopeptidase [Stenotrophomonas sp. C3(2023)]
MQSVLIELLQRLAWTSLQTAVLVAVVAALCRFVPSLAPAVRCRLWWLVSLQAVVGLVWHQPLQLPWLPAPAVSVAHSVAMPAETLIATTTTAAGAPLLTPTAIAVPAAGTGVPVWVAALAALWLAGVLLMTLRTLRAWQRSRTLLSDARQCHDQTLLHALAMAAEAHGLRRAPRLAMSSAIDAPQLVGPLRPVLLLPAGAHALQGDALDLALTHELQHLQRRDLQWGVLPVIAEHLLFFHPLLRWAVREYAQAREEAVDAAVVAGHADCRHDYGRLLLQLGVSPRPQMGVASAAPSTASLKRRLLSLQAQRACPKALAAGLTLAVLAVAIAPMRLVASAPPALPAPPSVPAAPAAAQDDEDPMVLITHGRLDLGAPPPRAHVLVDGQQSFASAGLEDIKQARRVVGEHAPALWFREGDVRYLVRDPALVAPLRAVYAEAADLGRQQGTLGREQGELGRQQRERAAAIARDAMQSTRAALEEAGLRLDERDINRDAAAEADGMGKRVASQVARAERAARMAGDIATQHVQRNADISRLANQQAELAGRQIALAQRQTAVQERASQQVEQVIARALASGKAQRL